MGHSSTLDGASLNVVHGNPRSSFARIDEHVDEGAGFIVESVLARVREQLLERRWPRATYRLQFSSNFTFRQATDLVEYWSQLGISDCYASPYLKATAGSTHGYDVVSHESFNPELGSNEDFTTFVAALRTRGLGHILDFVPNHMGIASNDNVWFQDVLENGPSSTYAKFFDIDWNPLKTDLQNKVLLPVLGQQFGQVLEDQQLILEYQSGGFFLNYYNRRFPIAPSTFRLILRHRLDELEQQLGSNHPQLLELHSILTAISHLPPRHETVPVKCDERRREKEVIKWRIQRLCADCSEVSHFIQENVRIFNGCRGEPRSFDLLDELLQDQAYRLSFWRVAADEINYRRFFDVNELAAICVERPEVFERAHTLVWQLLQAQQVDGIRIDHADGLFDPTGYLWQLQERRYLQLCQAAVEPECLRIGEPCLPWSQLEEAFRRHFDELRSSEPDSPLLRSLFLVVEKILERTERLPEAWPVHGTTGYEFLNDLNGLFVDSSKARVMDGIYTKFTGAKSDFKELTYHSKRLILKVSMSSELHVLGHKLDRISERNRWTRDFTLHGLIQALREVIACFPIYRTYTIEDEVLDRDRDYIERAVASAKHRNPAFSVEAFDFIRQVLLCVDADLLPPDERLLRQEFVGRFQQFTGPMMAKAVEDTAFYRFNRLISLNEVGGDPERFGVSVEEFHLRNLRRHRHYPLGLLATSTHDTKRSEDVRARINVLSEIPTQWKACTLQWARWNKKEKTKIDGALAPSKNDEYLLYQTLLGAWPLISPKGQALKEFVARIRQYMTKAVREAKVHSSWIAPNEPYERALDLFIDNILQDDPESAFRSHFEDFAKGITHAGFWNSLSQTLIKLTSPGVPDIYQGTELWNFSLVDPDNRRPVDFERQQSILSAMLQEMSEQAVSQVEFVRQLMATATDGRIKLLLLMQILRFRSEHSTLFESGDYLPLEVQGCRCEQVVAYARCHDEQFVIIVAPRLCAATSEYVGAPPITPDFWQDTRILLPRDVGRSDMRHLLTGETVSRKTGSGVLLVADILHVVPVGMLVNDAVL